MNPLYPVAGDCIVSDQINGFVQEIHCFQMIENQCFQTICKGCFCQNHIHTRLLSNLLKHRLISSMC